MNARVGDLVIVRFNPDIDDYRRGKKWKERVGFVTAYHSISSNPCKYDCIYWYKDGRKKIFCQHCFPGRRLVRVKLCVGVEWEGSLFDIGIDNVDPIT